MNKILEARNELKALEIPVLTHIGVAVLSILIASLVAFPFIALLVNLLVFINYLTLIIIGIGLVVYLAIFLSLYLYYLGITKGKIKSIIYLVLFDAIIF